MPEKSRKLPKFEQSILSAIQKSGQCSAVDLAKILYPNLPPRKKTSQVSVGLKRLAKKGYVEFISKQGKRAIYAPTREISETIPPEPAISRSQSQTTLPQPALSDTSITQDPTKTKHQTLEKRIYKELRKTGRSSASDISKRLFGSSKKTREVSEYLGRLEEKGAIEKREKLGKKTIFSDKYSNKFKKQYPYLPRSEQEVLGALNSIGSANPKDIAEYMGQVQRKHISKTYVLLKRLQKKGLVTTIKKQGRTYYNVDKGKFEQITHKSFSPSLPSSNKAPAMFILAILVIFIFYISLDPLGFVTSGTIGDKLVLSLQNNNENFQYIISNQHSVEITDLTVSLILDNQSSLIDPGEAESEGQVLSWEVTRLEPGEEKIFSFSAQDLEEATIKAIGFTDDEIKRTSLPIFQFSDNSYDYWNIGLDEELWIKTIGVSFTIDVPDNSVPKPVEETIPEPEGPTGQAITDSEISLEPSPEEILSAIENEYPVKIYLDNDEEINGNEILIGETTVTEDLSTSFSLAVSHKTFSTSSRILVESNTDVSITAVELVLLESIKIQEQEKIIISTEELDVKPDIPPTDTPSDIDTTPLPTEPTPSEPKVDTEIIDGTSVEKETRQYSARLGQPVRWKKKITLSQEKSLAIEIPELATGITVTDVETGQTLSAKVDDKTIEEHEQAVREGSITGNIITGFVPVADIIVEDKELVQTADLVIEEIVEVVEIEYETPAPTAEEFITEKGKKIIISSEVQYENVLSFMEIPETKPNLIILYWQEDSIGEKKDVTKNSEIDLQMYDTNGDSLIDYIEWITPHLSDQTFEVEIKILNPYEYLKDGDEWTVMFETNGVADLYIESPNAEWTEMLTDLPTLDEMEFLEIKCGDTSLENNLLLIDATDTEIAYTDLTSSDNFKPVKFYIPDYSCGETAYFKNLMHIAGYATLQFTFGDEVAYAYDPPQPGYDGDGEGCVGAGYYYCLGGTYDLDCFDSSNDCDGSGSPDCVGGGGRCITDLDLQTCGSCLNTGGYNSWCPNTYTCYAEADCTGTCGVANADCVTSAGSCTCEYEPLCEIYCTAGAYAPDGGDAKGNVCQSNSNCDSTSGCLSDRLCDSNSDCVAGKFCSQSTDRCAADLGTGYECGDDITKLDTDEENNGACTSSYCRTTIGGTDNDKYCAADSDDCVDYDGSEPAASRNTGYKACEGPDYHYVCSFTPGVWSGANECGSAGCSGDSILQDSTCVESTGCSSQNPTECPTCETCSAGACVDRADNTQDTVGSNLCQSDCVNCDGSGNCVNQGDAEDLFSQCSADWTSCDSTCVRRGPDGFCDGAGACDTNDATDNIDSLYVCTGSGEQTFVSTVNYCYYNETCDSGDCSAMRSWTSCDGTGSCRPITDLTDSFQQAAYADVGKTLTDSCGTSGSSNCGYSDWNDCAGVGSPYSCTKQRDVYHCAADHTCSYDTGDSWQVVNESGKVCVNGEQVAGDTTYYAFSNDPYKCNSSDPGVGFDDAVYDVFACDGAGSDGPKVGEIEVECGTGCCYDAGATASCIASPDYNNYNWYDFGAGDNGITDYCLVSVVYDCYDNNDCASGYTCNATSQCEPLCGELTSNFTLTEDRECTTLTIYPGVIVNTSTYSLNVTNNLTINGTLNASYGGIMRFGNITINPGGEYNGTGQTTFVSDYFTNYGVVDVSENGFVNVTKNISHNNITHLGSNVSWYVYGNWDGSGTINRDTAIVTFYNGSSAGGSLTGGSRYIYHLIIPANQNITKGNSDFGVRDGKCEIYGKLESISGNDLDFIFYSLEDQITIGPSANVSTLNLMTVADNTIPESIWGALTFTNGGIQTLSGNINITTIQSTSTIDHWDSDKNTTLNMNGYNLTVVSGSMNLRIGDSGDQTGKDGFVYMNGGSITGFNNIILYSEDSLLNTTAGGEIQATSLQIRNGTVNTTSAKINVTTLMVNDSFYGETGEHYATSIQINSGGNYIATSGTTVLTGNFENYGSFTNNTGTFSFSGNSTLTGETDFNSTIVSGNLTINSEVNYTIMNITSTGNLTYNSSNNDSSVVYYKYPGGFAQVTGNSILRSGSTWFNGTTDNDKILINITGSDYYINNVQDGSAWLVPAEDGWNIQPTIENLEVDDSISNPAAEIDLVGGSTQFVNCTSIINDKNGANTLDITEGVFFWESGGESPSCNEDANNCYHNNSCHFTSIVGNNTAKNVECGFLVWYNSQNTTNTGWTCNVTANDTQNLWTNGTGTEIATKVNSLVAVDINSSTLDFGTLNPGQDSPASMNVSNYGNIEIDIRLNGTNLTCDTGKIPVTNLIYNCTDPITELSSGKGTNLTTSLTTCSDFNLQKSSDTSTPAPENDTVYWRIIAPYGENVKGSCSGTIWFLGTTS